MSKKDASVHRDLEEWLSVSWAVLNLSNHKMKEIWLAEQQTSTVKMKIMLRILVPGLSD